MRGSSKNLGPEQSLKLARGYASAMHRQEYAESHGWTDTGLRKLAIRMGVPLPRRAGKGIPRPRKIIEQVREALVTTADASAVGLAGGAKPASALHDELERLRKENLVLRTNLTLAIERGYLDFLSLEVKSK